MKEIKLLSSGLKKVKDMPLTSLPFFLIVVSIFLLIFYILTNRSSESFKYGYEVMEICKDLSISTIAAGIFFYFQVYIPQKQKNASLKNLLIKKWKYRKNRILYLFWEEMWRTKQINQGIASNDFIEDIGNFKKFRSFCEGFPVGKTSFSGIESVYDNLSSKFSNGVLQQFDAFLQDINQSLSLGTLDTHDKLLCVLIEFEETIDAVNFTQTLNEYQGYGTGEIEKERLVKGLFFRIFLSRDKTLQYLGYDWMDNNLNKIGL